MSLKSLTHKKLSQIHAQLIKTQIPQTLNPLLKSLTNSKNPQNALLMYNQMVLRYPTSHNHYTFTYALNASSSLFAHQKGLEIHAHVSKTGHYNDIFIQNSLLHFYVTQNDIVSASKVFDFMRSPNVVSWSLIISGLSRLGFEREAIVKFSSMEVEPNSYTLVAVVSACSNLRALKLGKAIHGYSLRNFSENNVVLDNAVLGLYNKCGSLVYAKQMFERMAKRDVFSWTMLIGGYAQGGLCDEAVEIFKRMVDIGEAAPNEATIVNLLSACSSVGALNLGEWLRCFVDGRGDLAGNRSVGNALINMYVKCGDLGMAFRVFEALEGKDVVSWSTVISGLALSGCGRRALQLFSLMLVNGVSPDGVTFVGLLSACSHAGLVDQGLRLFNSMREVYGFEPRVQHYACVVDMYGRAGMLEAAEAFVREMPIEADNAVWGALLNACKIHANDEMFERIRRRVIDGGGEVSIGTIALLSNAYAACDRWDDANKIRDEITRMGPKKTLGYSRIQAGQQP